MINESLPLGGRLVRFTLEDVPPSIRRRFGQHLLRHATEDGDLAEAVALKRAIEYPSTRGYWIREAAWLNVMDGH